MYDQILPQVTFIEAIKRGFSKICCFQGRARRSEYWFFYLFTQFVLFVPVIIFIVIFFREIIQLLFKRNIKLALNGIGIGFLILLIIVIIVSIPLLSLSVRRLHDTGKSGCLLFLYLIPIVGLIIIFIFLLEDSHQHTNKYGPSPKYIITQSAPLLSNSQMSSFVGNPYINPQVSPGFPVPNPPPYQQYPEVQPIPQVIDNQFVVEENNVQIVEQQNQQMIEPINVEIIEPRNLQIVDQQNQQLIEQQNIEEQNVQIIEQQNQQLIEPKNIEEQNAQIIEQQNQQVDEQQNQNVDNQQNQQIDEQKNPKVDNQQNQQVDEHQNPNVDNQQIQQNDEMLNQNVVNQENIEPGLSEENK